ncbi:MAG: response regulator [Gammaproteobacteria bacterium]|nr:response regulator [Gammaproteobacteria bacterium]
MTTDVLLIEDDSDQVELIKLIFDAQDSYRLSVASSIAEANLFLKTRQPDLVLCDFLLPDGEGLAFITDLKGKAKFPLVLMTAFGDEQMAVEAIKAGALAYVTKSKEAIVNLPQTVDKVILEWRSLQRIKEAEQALIESEKKYRSLFDDAQDLIFILDSDFLLIDTNQFFNSTLALAREEAIGKSFLTFLPNDKKKAATTMLNAILHKGEIITRFETSVRRKDGALLELELNATPYLESKEVVAIRIIARDFTERYQQQKEKQWLEQQLQQSQKMQAIGQLTGGIAHDFNNILASIVGYVNLAIERYQDTVEEKLLHYLHEIAHAGERGTELVQQMLAFSREGKSQSQANEIKFLLDKVLGMLHPVMPSSIDTQLNIASELPLVNADPVQFHQVLMNLCINARDAMNGQGKLFISVDKRNLTEGFCTSCHKPIHGQFIEIAVRDTGTGIPMDVVDRIFQPFFTTKEVGRGTGMGLAMVHGILHDHGGHVMVETKANQGTCFRLFFPASFAETENKSKVKQAKIMIVDDEASVLRFLKNLFVVQQFEVFAFENPKDALVFFEQQPTNFDLIITDQRMPDMQGHEFARHIHALCPSLPIIMCSGFQPYAPEDRQEDNVIRRFLPKPIDSLKLIEEVNFLVASNSS